MRSKLKSLRFLLTQTLIARGYEKKMGFAGIVSYQAIACSYTMMLMGFEAFSFERGLLFTRVNRNHSNQERT
jgi:hypothetical protein